MPAIRIYDDKSALTQAAADYVLACFDDAVATHDYFALALSGGSTPRALYVRLAKLIHERGIDASKLRVFWGDERTVPPDHAESNFRMAQETLLEPAAIPSENVYRMRGELPPEQAAADYESVLRDFFGAEERFDLVLLGMGDDGHTASLFPHTPALSETERLVVANYVPKLETWRITLTAPAINSAAHVAFLVAGSAKATPLQAVLEGPHRPDELPSQLIQPVGGDLVWLVDRAAAADLQEGR